ncbi:MAG: ribosome recycling factor [Chitinophagaceae bacterium]
MVKSAVTERVSRQKLQLEVYAVTAIEQIKKLQKDGLSEDQAKDAETEIQEMTDKFISLVEKHLEAKEKEIMSV